MKKLFYTIAATTFIFAKAQANLNWDACYQLYLPSVMYPVVCLDGTQEEGIGGSSTRMVIFHTNTDSISACAVSSGLKGSFNSLEFVVGSKKEMILSEAKLISGRLEGRATFGNTQLQFIQLDSKTSSRLIKKFYTENRCQNLEPGQLIMLRN